MDGFLARDFPCQKAIFDRKNFLPESSCFLCNKLKNFPQTFIKFYKKPAEIEVEMCYNDVVNNQAGVDGPMTYQRETLSCKEVQHNGWFC